MDDEEPMSGWCQKLHAVQCLFAPVFTVFAINAAFVQVKGDIGRKICPAVKGTTLRTLLTLGHIINLLAC